MKYSEETMIYSAVSLMSKQNKIQKWQKEALNHRRSHVENLAKLKKGVVARTRPLFKIEVHR